MTEYLFEIMQFVAMAWFIALMNYPLIAIPGLIGVGFVAGVVVGRRTKKG